MQSNRDHHQPQVQASNEDGDNQQQSGISTYAGHNLPKEEVLALDACFNLREGEGGG